MSDRKTYAPHCAPDAMRRRHLARDVQTLAWAEARGLGKSAQTTLEVSRRPFRSAKNIKQRAR